MAENTTNQTLIDHFNQETARLNAQFFQGIHDNGVRFVDELVRGSFGFDHFNPLSTKKGEVTYNGRNTMRLALNCYERNYASPNWTTFKMMQEKGWKPKKTAHPVVLQNFSFRNLHDEDGKVLKDENGKNVTTSRVYANAPFLVYNYDDIEGEDVPVFEQKHVKHLGEEETLATAYMVIQAWESNGGCKVVIDEHVESAYYSPASDEIHIPSAGRFKTAKAFAGTLLHEIIHSTGAKSRIGRLNGFRPGSFKYAREELTAEIGSAYLECFLGIDRDYDQAHWDNHAAYVKSWAKKFDGHNDAIFKAANDAKYAARTVLEAIEKFGAKNEETVTAFAFVSGLDELLAA